MTDLLSQVAKEIYTASPVLLFREHMALSSAEKEQTKSKANPLIALLNLQPETV